MLQRFASGVVASLSQKTTHGADREDGVAPEGASADIDDENAFLDDFILDDRSRECVRSNFF